MVAGADPRVHSGVSDFVVVANRLPIDMERHPDGSTTWKRSPGGLVTAMEPLLRRRRGAWIGWPGIPDDAADISVDVEPIVEDDLRLYPVGLTSADVAEYYEGFSNATLWPLYHDVIVKPIYHREWWDAYVRVNRRFADAAIEAAAEGAVVWVHDYQLQLVPALLRELRPDLRIGWFNHIPFPPVELFAQLPWRSQLIEGLMGADYLGFQRSTDAANFVRSARQLAGMATKGEVVTGADGRRVRASAIPISIDFADLDALARTPEVIARSNEIREQVGNPEVLMLGVDRLDYTKGIRHRLKAYQELLADGHYTPPQVTLVQVAVPSRERVDAYKRLKDQIEGEVGRINGEYSTVGAAAVHYLHQSFDRAEMAAMYLAADIMLVTPLRDGMNLVAKEYVTCRFDLGGALVLSEFTGAANELTAAFMHNPHDIQGLKNTIRQAVEAPVSQKRRRMRSLRRRVRDHDVQRWAERFLQALASAPDRPTPHPDR